MKVLVEKKEKICTIQINRPSVRNAVDRETAQQLAEAFREFEIKPTRLTRNERYTEGRIMRIRIWLLALAPLGLVGCAEEPVPVAAAIAFATAGATGGTPGSPIPVGFSVEGTM